MGGLFLYHKKWIILFLVLIGLTIGCGQKFQTVTTQSQSESIQEISEFIIELNSNLEAVNEGADVLVVATIVGDDKSILSLNWQKQDEIGLWTNIGAQNLSLTLNNVGVMDSGIYQLSVTYQPTVGEVLTVNSQEFQLIVESIPVIPSPSPAPLDCGSLSHGSSQTRVMYQEASVVAPATCQNQSQARVCYNGTLSDWSPNTFQSTTCVVRPIVLPTLRNCGNLVHGATESRVRYRELQVTAPATCQAETQTRSCNDGTLGDWSPMNYFSQSCMVIMPITELPITSGYYVSPNGSDTNSGEINSPFRTFARAYSSATPGTTIYLRGGVYAPSTQLLLNRSGTSGNPIRVYNYPGEVPVIDGINMSTDSWTQGAAVRITGHWNHVKGLEVRNGPEFGAVMDNSASNNTFEQLNVHHSGRLSMWEGKGIAIFGTGSNNLILNCDSHHNRDLQNGNADGFMVSTTGSGTVLRGNRAWKNSDDGFDFFNIANNTIGGLYTLEDNWAFENGYDDNFNVLGDGNGFKLGGRRVGTTGINGGHFVRNCIAWGNHANGFDDNGWHGGTQNFTLYNNTSYNNGYSNFAFTNTQSNFKNNISIGSLRGVETRAGSNTSYNSWTLPVTANASDFVNVNSSFGTAPRNPDGSLPTSNLFRLAIGSDLINRGIDVSLPFNGSAPDLGAYEF